MKRYLLTAGLFTLAVATVSFAQDPNPWQPGGKKARSGKGGGFPAGGQFPGGGGSFPGGQFGGGGFQGGGFPGGQFGGGNFQGGGFGGQFGGGGFGEVVFASRTAALEEELELTEAQRDIRKAYVKAAEVGLKGAEINYDRISKIGAAGVIGREEIDKAKLEIEAAKAQLEIRQAELKEIEVKVKYARKRLDDARPRPPFMRDSTPVAPPPRDK